MKCRFRETFSVLCMTALLLTSCALPGSDQYKIKSATKAYAMLQLEEVERYEWNYLERKHYTWVEEYGGCKEVLVHYNIIADGEEKQPRILYLLMSEHCDSVYEVRDFSSGLKH